MRHFKVRLTSEIDSEVRYLLQVKQGTVRAFQPSDSNRGFLVFEMSYDYDNGKWYIHPADYEMPLSLYRELLQLAIDRQEE